MGPRLVSRGKMDAIPPIDHPEQQLQLGRDLLVAESLEANEPKKAAELLQWGRDLLVAESRSASV